MKRFNALIVLCTVTLTAIMIGLVLANVYGSATAQRQAGIIDTLSSNNEALREQVKKLGETPVAPPAATVTKDAPPVTLNGSDGRDGEPGERGPGPSDGQVFFAVQQYCALMICVGPQGPSGAPGGAGANGQDSTVPGPQGPPGADSTVPGPPGATGPPGGNGEPPLSWTYTDMLGGSHTCTRTDPFDPSSPTYTCN